MRQKNAFTIIAVLLSGVVCLAQNTILPGDKSIDVNYLASEYYVMGYSIKQNGNFIEIGDYETTIQVKNEKYEVKTSLNFSNSTIQWKEYFIADSKNLKPIQFESYRDDERTIKVSYTKDIVGEIHNLKSGKKTIINETIKRPFFDISIYPFIVRALPLVSGYKAIIPVFDAEAIDAKKRFSNVIVKETKSDIYISSFTGQHSVWKVNVVEENTGNIFHFYIDKISRKLWKISILSSKGGNIELVNKEVDFNPFKNKFNKDETLKLVNNGNSTIEGVAFARDNENEGALKGIAILNINKKQFAPKGTTIVLTPHTSFYKEWLEVNKKQLKIKNAKPIPLPKEAFDCIKFTTVYDDEGHFEFTNLMPGDYLLTTSFGYSHTSKRSEVTGVSDVFYKGNYVGSNVYTSVFAYAVPGQANIQKIVTIKKENEIVKLKLKKTN